MRVEVNNNNNNTILFSQINYSLNIINLNLRPTDNSIALYSCSPQGEK